MQREIKFRAASDSRVYPVTELMWSDRTAYILRDEEHENLVSMDDIELLQFTGLKDKNGKEIYEGDIVECERLSHQPAGKSEWKKFKFPITRTEHKFMYEVSNGAYMDIYPAEAMEIVGNIYETPTLGL